MHMEFPDSARLLNVLTLPFALNVCHDRIMHPTEPTVFAALLTPSDIAESEIVANTFVPRANPSTRWVIFVEAFGTGFEALIQTDSKIVTAISGNSLAADLPPAKQISQLPYP